MAWTSSSRRTQLPSNWSSEIVPRIRRRDRDHCQNCGITERPEVDHIGDPHDHSDTNLRVLCHWCHAQRTAQQAAQARGPAVTERRPAERHPGLT